MGIFDEQKIDCHAHVLDPVRFPYATDVHYKPQGSEIGRVEQFVQVLDTYGVLHALLVQPNSGYGGDNRCLFDALERFPKRFKGIAIAPLDADLDTLKAMKAKGVVGVALNPTVYGNAYYAEAKALMARLADLDLYCQLQIEHDFLLMYQPWIEALPVHVLIDHCGRPSVDAGLNQPGFQALLALSQTGRVHVKLSGYAKFSHQIAPFADCQPHVDALIANFGLDHCMWASDWPYLRAQDRQDYGPLLKHVERLFPNPSDRHQLLWQTPQRLFGFDE